MDTVIRLGCPSDVLLCLITNGTFSPTGDSLIDENLESMREEKEFTNWGGNHNPTGKNQYSNKKSGQLGGQKRGQLDRQDGGQDVDKDIDIDKDNNKEIYNIYFEEFWNLYTPIKCDGRFVAKGDKKSSLAKFKKILDKGEKYENIIRGTKQYIDYCRENNQLTCGVPVFLNQERWKNDYSGSTCQSSERGKRQEPRSIVETYAEIAAQYV